MAEAAAILMEESTMSRYEMYKAYARWVKESRLADTPEAFVRWDQECNGCAALDWNKSREQAWLDDLREQARLFILSYSRTVTYESGQMVRLPEIRWNGSEYESAEQPGVLKKMLEHHERVIESQGLLLVLAIRRLGKPVPKARIKRATMRAMDRALSPKKCAAGKRKAKS
jgi:hypothetical protein